ncbi:MULTISPECIES: prolyl aminopeptidase [unclassified Paracoccus (in: a-proteobacteria)]|uniref:prolyl aminopeptidase n=1 Tax=unclassified Paracoccus (in: a-proteobacteria) TaxID=2688777 RepID=UPI0012B28586|nr:MULTISPECIES: prolyl aminopeptidase [unclassified Paracoccus (in: a-proteobacteria)]UXU75953.1 prolyl aminopeptidase [Paracoccus sp. SMMA_5]UXU81862.1 prolyl aminopeptidase [Paracoccus sp. SMMA_5_TC]
MDRLAGQIGAAASPGRLHPAVEPFDRRVIAVGDGHQLHVEQSGAADGEPVIVLHGGPGGGCSPFMRRFFDPSHYRAILFDQRGCGRSRPYAEVAANTTAHLIADIDLIRRQLGIERAILFGGSWGSTLALAYAQAHPHAVSGLILRGVFLGQRNELDWFYGGGVARFFPDRWAEFQAPIPEAERDDMIGAYHRRLFSGDRGQEARFALPWLIWENALAGLEITGPGYAPPDYARAFARLENHYFANGCFLDEGQILRDRHRIEHIPAVIVQGRYDMVCPPASAWALARGWDRAELRMVPASGHALSEPRIAAELVRVMDGLRDMARERADAIRDADA